MAAEILTVLLASFVASTVTLPALIASLGRAGITGKDLHKPGQPRIPEMGGLAIVVGFGFGILLAVALVSFTGLFHVVDLRLLLAVLSTVLIAALIGIIDDLVSLGHWVKALAPLVSALPLVAVKVGDSTMGVPFIGQVNFGLLYSLVFVPVGVTVAANVTNMLAGFNGLETGMGIIAMATLAVVAIHLGQTTALVILLAALGPLVATIRFNWYPAKVFLGDVGTLSIGAVIASAVIVGNFETAGVIVIIPYFADFLLKAWNHFPSQGWSGIYRDGKLYCPEHGIKGLGQLVMKMTGGISERNLTLILIAAETICGAVAVLMLW